MLPAIIKPLIPLPLRQWGHRLTVQRYDQWHRDRALVQIVAAIRATGLDRPALTALRHAWGNEGYSADVAYLEAVADACRSTDHPVFECGSGVTTLVAGLTARAVWSVESSAYWARHLRRRLARCHFVNVHTFHVQIMDDWYDVRALPLPRHFGVVLCDGPRGTGADPYAARGHVLTRLDATWDRLLADDAPQSAAVLTRWREEFGCHVRLTEAQEGTYAIVTPR